MPPSMSTLICFVAAIPTILLKCSSRHWLVRFVRLLNRIHESTEFRPQRVLSSAQERSNDCNCRLRNRQFRIVSARARTLRGQGGHDRKRRRVVGRGRHGSPRQGRYCCFKVGKGTVQPPTMDRPTL